MPNALRPLLLILLAATGFALVAEGMSRVVPMPNFLGHWSKWEYFRRHKNEIDVLWLGTSHVARDIDNAAIQARLAERGVELEMFNFGLPGMGAYEQDYFLHRILALRSERLKYIFIEGGPIAMGVHPRHIFRNPNDNDTHRSVLWHNGRETGLVLEQIPLLPLPWVDQFDHGFEHLRLFARNVASYGLGTEIKRGLKGVRIDLPWLVEAKGHRSWESTHPDQVERSKDFTAEYERLGPDGVIELIEPDELARHTDLSGLNLDFYRAQYAAAAAHGVTLVYVTMPSSMVCSERPLLAREGVIEEFWHLNQPELYPEFFRVANRWDEEHLNASGIALMTEVLVERLTEYFAGQRD